ncbi:hypothetical protein [Bdellovibrio sp. NC01]|uniref:hypothetical protein n=1 Tax=Bdellovibrio sp. NC01 TaxID=2220073 RepID=UPI0011587C60|nr:hypothetical protein [Bdellovibrio sp. NC01]QDK39222.1 hypothetical protein DOE51_17310 [Bdellovibrio sp. NC01]
MRFLSCLLLLISSQAMAFIYPFPTGNEEALMANTGIAFEDSPGNVLYNPAGLAYYNSHKLKLSVSGNAIEQQRFKLDEMSDSSDPNIRPMLVTGIYPSERGTFALFVGNPLSYNVIQGSNSVISGFDVKTSVTAQTNVILAGISYAIFLNENLSAGISTGVTNQTSSVHSIGSASSGGVVKSLAVSQSHTKEMHYFLNPGVLWKVNDNYKIGFTIFSLPFKISSSGDYYASTMNANDPTLNKQVTSSYDPDGRDAFSFGLGQQFNVNDQKFFFDINYSMSADQKDSDGTTTQLPEQTSYGVGWKGFNSTSWHPLAGFAYLDNRTSETYSGTGGITRVDGNSELSLGLYYNKGLTKGNSQNSPFDAYGIIFSSNVGY